MNVALFLAGAALRSLALVATGWLAMPLFRVRSAAARHAVWTVIVAGMLISPALTPVAPTLAIRALPASPQVLVGQVSRPAQSVSLPVPAQREARSIPTPIAPLTDWNRIVALAYAAIALVFLARLALGYIFTLRLVRRSRPAGDFLESDWIAAPLTVGWLRPKIILPAGWREWEQDKLEAALAHERAHIQRADWAIAAMAAVNRCLFWFNPLAWWLERRIAALAEQACDDAALLSTGRRDAYARTLLDIAAAVRSMGGRLNWEAMAMTKPSEVRQRIDRILDESRLIPRGLSRGHRASLAAGALAATCLLASMHVVPARSPQQTADRAFNPKDVLYQTQFLTNADVARLESVVAANPDDLDARVTLIYYYTDKAIVLSSGGDETEPRGSGPDATTWPMVQKRDAHVLWIIQHHPDYDPVRYPTLGIFGGAGPLADPAGDERAAQLWLEQANLYPTDSHVILNAAEDLTSYYLARNRLFETEQWAKRAAELDATRRVRLASLYAMTIRETAAGQDLYNDQAFAAHVRDELDRSNDSALIWSVGYSLERSTSAYPDLAALNAYGKRLQRRAVEELGYKPPRLPTEADIARQAEARRQAFDGPDPIKRVEPAYPPLAQQSQIEGTVRVQVLIGTDGSVEQVEPVSGHPMLAPAAMAAVKQWRYAPQKLETLMQVDVPVKVVSGGSPRNPQ